MYKLEIYHDVRIKKDAQTGEYVLDKNWAESKFGFSTGHSYIALNDGGDKPIVRGFYPDNVYQDDSERIEFAQEFQKNNADFNAYHVKEIPLNKEQYERALDELNKYEKYIDKEKKQGTLPKEVINGMWRLLGNNCSDFTNTIYRSTGLPGSFTYQYTTPELKQIPGVIEYYIDKFGVGDREHIVSGGSIEDIALQYNVDKSLISETKAKNIPLDMDAQSMMGLGPKFYKIAPNMELMESMKQQIELKQTEESKEMFKDQFSKLSISPIDYSKFNKIELVSKEELSPRAKSLIIEKIGNFKVKFQQILDKFKSKIINAGKLVDENETTFEKQILESNAKKEAFKKLKQKEMDDFLEQSNKDANKQVVDIQSKGQKEVNDFIAQMKIVFDSKTASIKQKAQQEMDSFFEKKQAELNAAASVLRLNNPNADCSGLISQANTEIQNFKSQKTQEANQETKNVEKQVNADIENYRSQKEKDVKQVMSKLEVDGNKKIQDFKKAKQEEVDNEFKKLTPSEDGLKLSRAKLEAIENTQTTKVEEYRNKIDYLFNDPSITDRVKDAILNGNDADFIDQEIDVFIQGANSALSEI